VYIEDSINLQIANEVRDELEKEGIDVEMTREDDTYVSLSKRANKSNHSDADLFISIHQNASENKNAQGIETYYMGDSNKSLANYIHQNVIESTKGNDRNVREKNLQVLRDNQKPAILLECGFISNNTDGYRLSTKDYQEKLASGIVKGIKAYLDETNSNKMNSNSNTSNNDIKNNISNDTNNYLVVLNDVNIMSDRGKNFDVLGTLDKGTKIEVIDTKFDWHKIKYKDGYGYVSGVYVK
ncbi:MAG: N-acetylmuramoyl-L-alanine amidase, partial [Romboutsia sp.]|uniref:N-acetylmuramoyl-L-alanine amidase n=1 Tax=Romboutsia sp. TaxID=1965302 RepID=UPI003F3BE319